MSDEHETAAGPDPDATTPVRVDDQFADGSPVVAGSVAASDGLFAGRYRLGERLGSSTDTMPFEAVDEHLQQPVVVTMLHPDLSSRWEVRDRFRQVMPVVQELHHPNLPAVFDHGIDSWEGREVLFVVSERLGGGSLRDLLDRGRLLSPSQVLVVGLDACKALGALARAGLVHGDVRPGTLVFGDDRRLRLIDVGLAAVRSLAVGGATGRPLDIAKYASPEEAMGAEPDAKSDVYGLCLALLESVTGSLPFVGDSTVSTLANRVDKLLPVSADLGALAAVLERAGRPDPADRSSAAEFGRALVQAAERMPRPAPLPLVGLVAADEPAATVPAPTAQVSADPTGPVAREVIQIATTPVFETPSMGPVGAPPMIISTDPSGGLRAPVIDIEIDDEQVGGRRWVVVLLALMLVAGGAAAWWVSRTQYHTVPLLAALEEGVAQNQLGNDFVVTVSREFSEEIAQGAVIRTEPDAGVRLEEGAALTLVVSDGPAPRVLPELSGLTLDEAKQTLRDMGLKVEVSESVYDEEIPLDSVVSWSVPDSPAVVAGETVVVGTTVRLLPSAGAEPRRLPDLTGMTLREARAALEELGLVVAEGPQEFSNAVGVGQVIRSKPVAGRKVAKGATVTIFRSKGPDLVEMPLLDGLDPEAMQTALESAGFVVRIVGDPTLEFIEARYRGEQVVWGVPYPRGVRITLVFESAT